MIKLSIGDYDLEINNEINTKLFKNSETRTEKCDCIDCKNFEVASGFVSDQIKKIFTSMGVDISKPTELMLCYDEYGKVLYNGFYNIVGRLLNAESCYVLNGEDDSTKVYSIRYVNLTEDYKIGFSIGDNFIIDGISFPHLIVEFEGWFSRILKD